MMMFITTTNDAIPSHYHSIERPNDYEEFLAFAFFEHRDILERDRERLNVCQLLFKPTLHINTVGGIMKFKSNNDHHHHNRHTYLFLAVALCCLLLIEQVHGQADQVEYEFKPRVIRRQVGPARDRSELVMEETSAIASASSSVSSAPNLNGNNKVEAAADRLSAQPAGSGKRPVGQSDNQAAYSEDQNRPPKPNKKPSNRRPTSDSYVNNDDEDCNEDYDDDYRQLVNEPMRHFRRMMNSVFGQMSANMPMNPGKVAQRSA